MLKERILLLFSGVLLSTVLLSQTLFKINQYNILYDGRIMPVFTLYSGHSFSETWGVSAYFYVNGVKNSSWGEGLAGPTWTPLKGVSFSFLAGFQSNEAQLWRLSPLITISQKRFSGFASFEYGGQRHRWDVMAFYLMKNIKTGGELIRFYKMYAAGPRIELTLFKKQPVTVFYSGLWDWINKKPASMFGIYTSFGPD